MCKWGTSVTLDVIVPAPLSSTGVDKPKRVDVDACIAPVVKALNAAGIYTVASCCGHGKQLGNIALGDGRELLIAADYETARRVERTEPVAPRAALAGPPSAQGWQPMSTAPKDGTRVLIVGPGPLPLVASYAGRTKGWFPVASEIEIHPTHWMPLPLPPSADAAPEATQEPLIDAAFLAAKKAGL